MRNVVKNQKGVSLIAAVFIIVILAFMGLMFLSMISTGSMTAANDVQSAQAFSIAEGGLERAVYRLKNGTSCNPAYPANLNEANVLLGQGDFTIVGTNHTVSTVLSAGINNLVTIIPVTSIVNFAPVGRIMIESEIIDYYGISGNTLINAVRGVAGTTAAAHAINTPTAQDQCRIMSTGNLPSSARRVVERNLQNPGAMIVYAQGAANNIPFFRRWDGTRWGPERQATPLVAGVTIQYMVLKFARTRNEAILGTLDNSGAIRVQVWNGNTNTWSATTPVGNTTAGNSIYRGFDIEYETNGDRAIVVYNNNTNDQVSYRIWDGTSWSGATSIALGTTTISTWIEMAPNPLRLSDEIALIVLGSASAGSVKGMRWNGNTWDNMGIAAIWDTSVPGSTSKIIDVAYEQQTGRAMFIWGDSSGTDNQRYGIWNGNTLTWDVAYTTQLNISEMGGDADWIRLVPDPFSNNLMYGVQDDASDLNTRFWNSGGGAWVAGVGYAEHDGGVETTTNRTFDIVFETNPAFAGRAWLMWGTTAGTDFTRRRQWDGAAWGGITTFGDDASLVQLMAHQRTGTIFAGIYQSATSTNRDITALQNVGGAWSAETIMWGGATPSSLYERVFIAAERYYPIVSWREVVQ